MRAEGSRTAEEALAHLKQATAAHDPYPLVVADMQLPKMDGLALARAIKADPALARSRLVILTPFGKPLAPETVKAAGIAACRSKPVRQSTFLDCLTDVMAANHLPRTLIGAAAALPGTTASECRPALRVLVA